MSKHPLDADAESSAAKRAKTNGVRGVLGRSATTLTTSQPSFLPPKGDLNGVAQAGGAAKPAANEDAIAAKRAEIAAKFAKMMANKGGAAPAPPAAAVPSVPRPPAAAPMSDLQKKIAEAKKKVEAMASAGAANPYMATTSKAAKAPAAPVASSSSSLHPLLSGTAEYKAPTGKDRYKPMAPKFATTSANARQILQTPAPAIKRSLEQTAAPTLEEAKKNPYFDRRLGVESLAPKERKSRQLRFAQKGKFIALAEHVRAEARQNEMRERILEMSRKAGMDSDIDSTARKAKKQPPPPVEWWDALFLTNETYDDVDNGVADAIIAREDAEQGISRYIQHPIKMTAPQDKIQVEAKPLMLTPKEQKKLRRTNRAAELRDKQDRIRMGLLPPDPPKVKISNMMRVLTEEAVTDPTKIEAKVRKEMMQRHDKHVEDNNARKLTPQERAAKIEAKAEKDAALGIQAAVFKIGDLQYQPHKLKVIKNAQQQKLTGCIVFNPHFVFVLVEGGEKAIKKYKHLMMSRIKWDEEDPPEHQPIDEDDETAANGGEERKRTIQPGENYCQLIWSGTHRERLFDVLRLKSCPSDGLAREWLGPKAEHYFEMARSKAEEGI